MISFAGRYRFRTKRVPKGRALSAATRVALALLSLGGPLAGQSASPLLLDLPGQSAPIRYSPGALERATQVQDHVESMVENFDTWAKEKIPLGIYLLSPDDWSQIGLQEPYGVPAHMGGRGLALPAWGTPTTVSLWQTLTKSRLPTMPSATMSRGTPDEIASLLVADVIAIAELARLQLKSANFRGDKPWVEGVAAHIVALSGILAQKDPRLPEMRMIYSDLEAAGGGHGSHPLSAIGTTKSAQTRLWFESQYFNAATIAAQAGSKQPAKQMLKSARKQGGLIRAADLISTFPGLDSWLRSSFSKP